MTALALEVLRLHPGTNRTQNMQITLAQIKMHRQTHVWEHRGKKNPQNASEIAVDAGWIRAVSRLIDVPVQSGRTVAVTVPYFSGRAKTACGMCAPSSWQRGEGKEGEDTRASASRYELRTELAKHTKNWSLYHL